METVPGLVSCLMITKKSRLAFSTRAVKCFEWQNYPKKELIIVTDEIDLQQVCGRPCFHFQDKTLGELRNRSVEAAHGQFVCQWDDDDWYHPERIAKQVAHLKQHRVDGCVLGRQLMHWPARNLAVISEERNWEGTILAYKDKMPAYPALARNEDAIISKGMSLIRLNEPWLYTYTVHAENTWSEDHFDKLFRRSFALPVPSV